MEQRSRRWIVLAVLVGGVLGINFLVSYYTDWLWFGGLDHAAVFWRMLRARFASGILFGAIALLIVGTNIWLAGQFTRQALRLGGSPWEDGKAPGEVLLRSRMAYVVAAGALVFVLGNIGASQWPLLLRYVYDHPFGVSDPIFSQDVAYYVFNRMFDR